MTKAAAHKSAPVPKPAQRPAPTPRQPSRDEAAALKAFERAHKDRLAARLTKKLHQLGFDHSRFTHRSQGLDMRLTGVEPAHVIKDLFA